MEHYVEGKVVVVTGGTSGFGLEAARLLLEMGAKVAITGRNPERLANAKAELEGGGDLLAVRADACETGDWKKLVQEAVARWETIDVLVLNHGAGVKLAETEEMDDDTVRRVLDINLTSVIKGAREVVPVMKRAGRGHIVAVASVCAHRGWARYGAYSAAKAGVVAFIKCLHVEMGAWGGKATVFTPGAARTGFAAAAGIDASWQTVLPSAKEFARTLVHCIDVPENCFIQEACIWGTAQVPGMVNPF